MKYLKTFENKKTQYAKDYNEKYQPDNFKQLNFDLKYILKENNIPYEIYFYNDIKYKSGPCIKVYCDCYIDDDKKQILKNNNFTVFPGNYRYEFTWEWEKIKEEDIEAYIASRKYNL